MQLRLTRQALADLGLDIDSYCRLDARSYIEAHAVVAAFVDRRSQSPVGQETTNLPVTRAPVWNLHVDRWRGLTWHDRDESVVWLLGVGWHESGSRDDAYEVLKRRDTDSRLLPSEEDYLDLEDAPHEVAEFVEAAAIEMPRLVERARKTPGTEIRSVVAGRVGASVFVDVVTFEDDSLYETWVAFEQPPKQGAAPLPADYLTLLLALAFPHVEVSDLKWGGEFPRRGTRPNEVVVSVDHS